VPVHVGETLLENAKENEFAVAGWAVHLFGHIAVDLDSATLGETFDEPACGGSDAGLVKQRRVEKVRGGANLLQGSVGQCVEVVDEEEKIGAHGAGLTDEGYGHFHGGEGLSGGVVEFASDAAAFFILQGHEANGELAELILGLLADGDFGFETSQGLREFVRAFLDTEFEFVVCQAQFLFGALAFAGLGGEREESIAQAEMLAAEGVAEDGENGADEKSANDVVHLVLANELDGVAGIDEEIKNAAEAEEAAEDGWENAADNGAVCDCDVERNVKGDVAKNGVEKPAKQDGDCGRGDRDRITWGDARAREWRENGQRARWGGTLHTASITKGRRMPPNLGVTLKLQYGKLWTLRLKMHGVKRKLSGVAAEAGEKSANGGRKKRHRGK